MMNAVLEYSLWRVTPGMLSCDIVSRTCTQHVDRMIKIVTSYIYIHGSYHNIIVVRLSSAITISRMVVTLPVVMTAELLLRNNTTIPKVSDVSHYNLNFSLM